MPRKKKVKKIEPEKTCFASLVIQENLRQLAQWMVAKINDYGSRAGKYRSILYQLVGSKTLQKEIQTRILGKTLNSILGNIFDLRNTASLEKSATNLPVSASLNLSHTFMMNAVKGILKNTAKAGLVSVLVDGLVASAEVARLVSKKEITKKNVYVI